VQNAKLAVATTQKFFERKEGLDADKLPRKTVVQALERTKWPGRCQTVQDPKQANLTWFLDGAHTVESLESCIKWFVSPDTALRPTPS